MSPYDKRRAGRDRAGDRVDRAVELGHAGLVEDHAGQVDRLAVEQRDDAVDRGAHRGRRRLGLRSREPAAQAGDGPLSASIPAIAAPTMPRAPQAIAQVPIAVSKRA